MVYVLAGEYARDPEIAAIGFLDWDVSSIQRRGGAIPADKLPERLEIVSKAPMPDFFQWQLNQFIVSDHFRKELEGIAPKQFEYLPMSLHGTDSLNLQQRYYFLNCLFFDQLIDWSKIEPQDNYSEVTDRHGRKVLSAPLPSEKRKMHFKPIPSMRIWREQNVEATGIVYAFYPQIILLADDAWAQLDHVFPGQLDIGTRFRS